MLYQHDHSPWTWMYTCQFTANPRCVRTSPPAGRGLTLGSPAPCTTPSNWGWGWTRDGPQLKRRSSRTATTFFPISPASHSLGVNGGLCRSGVGFYSPPSPLRGSMASWASQVRLLLPRNRSGWVGEQASWDHSNFNTCQRTLLQYRPHMGGHCTRWVMCQFTTIISRHQLQLSPALQAMCGGDWA
jgi:hypothetical protein